MKKNPTALIFSLSVITTIASLSVLIFFFKVIENKNQHTSAVLATLSDKIAEKDNSKAMTEKITEINKAKDTINSYFVNSKEIDSFINYLENIDTTNSTELKVEGFDISPGSKNTLIVRISTKGTFSNIMRTLVLLENAPYKIHIIRTSFNQQIESSLDPKDPKKTINTTGWQSDTSFSVLISV